MPYKSRRNIEWTIREDGDTISYDGAMLAVLMDIRSELRVLRSIFACDNFRAVPNLLRDLRRNTQRHPRLRIVKKRRAA